jgi:hypothetical protein
VGLYPNRAQPNPNKSATFNKIMIDLRMQQNASHAVWQRYFAVSYRAQLLEIAGIAVGDQVQGLAKYVYLKQGPWLLWREEVKMLGLHLHRVSHIEATQLMAALACEGSFRDVQYWEVTNQTLVQGA